MGDSTKGVLGMLGGQAASGALGLTLGYFNDARQRAQQEKLTAIQEAAQNRLADKQALRNLEYWKLTGPVAQKEQLKAAGLNPALMYGMGGGTGGQSMGGSPSAGGGNAPAGGKEVQDMLGMGMQLQLLKAQKENIEADTNLKLTDAQKKSGVDTQLAQSQIEQLKATVKTEAAKQMLTEAQADMAQLEYMWKAKMDFNKVVWGMQAAYTKMEYDLKEQIADSKISEEEAINIKKSIAADLALKGAQKAMLDSNISLNSAQQTQIAAQIQRIAQEIAESKARVENMGKRFDLDAEWNKHRVEIENVNDAIKLGVQSVTGIVNAAVGLRSRTTTTTTVGETEKGGAYYNKTTTKQN